MTQSPEIHHPKTNRIDATLTDAPPLAGYGAGPIGVTTLTLPHAARSLTVEVWYPAAPGTPPGGRYETLLRDGVTPITLHGRAARDAAVAPGAWPLVILSHGYPGNRMLMSHLGESLSSRGYVVAALDHPLSTYADKGDFGETLLHRPLDQAFALASLMEHPVWGPRLLPRAAVVGYSMGAYGALVFGGAGLSDTALKAEAAPPDLTRHGEGRPTQPDPRLKAIVPIGLWGGQHGFWTDTELSRLTMPCLMIAGSADEVSSFSNGMEKVFLSLRHPDQHLITFAGAGHNAAAPIPAPQESWTPQPALDFLPAEHYADPVWDTVRMNAAAQHLVALFLNRHLKGQGPGVTHDASGRPSGMGPEWQGLSLRHAVT